MTVWNIQKNANIELFIFLLYHSSTQ